MAAIPAIELKNITKTFGAKVVANKNVCLTANRGEILSILGENGSGKSTLSKVLCGHPDYEVISGTAELDGQDLFAMSVDERSRAGLFLAFQYPVEVPGVTNANFMRAALQARLPKGEELDAVAFYKELRGKMKELGIDPGELQTAIEVRSTESIKKMVSEGMGVAVLSKSACEDYEQFGKVLAFDFDNITLRRKLFLIKYKNNILSPIAQVFYDYAKNYYRK